MVNRKVINTCKDGTCRTLVAWYAKGGRSNFAAWNGADRFLMTAVLVEENDDDYGIPVNREIYKFQGYGKNDNRDGGHYVKFIEGDGTIAPTLTTLSFMGLSLVVEYDIDTDEEGSE